MKGKHRYSSFLKGLLLLLLLLPLTISAQDNWFYFKEKQNFSQSTPNAFIYKIPADSVYGIVYERKNISPSTGWIQRPAYVIARQRVDSLMQSNIPAGYYVLVYGDNNAIALHIKRKQAFYTRTLNMREDMLLEVRDTSGNLVQNAEIMVGKKRVYYDTMLRGYITNHKHTDEIIVRHGGDIEFYEGTKTLNRPYYNDYYNNWDHSEPARTDFKGYLVTNKPKYLPGDTVKYKAYVLNPWLDKPMKEPLQVELTEQYNYRPMAIGTVRYTEPGVYFSEFVLGDSIKPDRMYTLTVKSERYRISQQLKVEDYLLEDTYLKVKGENVRYFQQGDSVHLYAHAYTSNSLPVLDGNITITVIPYFQQLKEKKTTFLPDTLYHKIVPVDPSGETYIGFATKDFADVLLSLNCTISLTNSNFEKKDTVITIQKSINDAYLSVKQEGTKIKAEAIRNKKSVTAKGYIQNGWGGRIPVTYPFEYTIREIDHYVHFTLLNDTGGIADNSRFDIYYDQLEVYDDFKNDTAYLQVANTQKLWVKYKLYVGDKFYGSGVVTSDTLLKVRSRKGKTVTMLAYYTWRNDAKSKIFKAEKLDKKMVIDVQKKDIIYPGQADTIKLNLSNVDGKRIPKTNVTVLAFNSQFTEDYVPDFPYTSGNREGLGGAQYTMYLNQKQMNNYHGNQEMTRAWAKRCGADTMFFYRNIFFSPHNVAWYLYDIPEPAPQLAVYLKQGNSYRQPEMITIDGRMAYIKQATVTTDPHALIVPEGNHQVMLRFANEQFYVHNVTTCKGIKTNLFVNVDSLKQINKDSLRPFVIRKEITDTFDMQEKQWMASHMLLFNSETYQQMTLIQGNHQYVLPGYGRRTGMRDYGGVVTAGPFNMNDSITYYQFGNTKLRFAPERDYIFTMRPAMTRVEWWPAINRLTARVSGGTYWPMPDRVTPPPTHYDSLLVYPKPVIADTVIRNGISYRIQPYMPVAGKEHSARLSLLNETGKQIKFIFLNPLNDTARPIVVYNSYQHEFHLKPGRYDLIALWTDSTASKMENITVQANGRTLVPLLYDSLKFNFGKAPKWIAKYVSYSYDTSKHIVYSQQYEPVYTPHTGGQSYNGAGAITGTVLDEKKEPMIGAIVQVLEGDVVKGGSATDVDGAYAVKPLRPGRYTVKITYQSYRTSIVSNVIVGSDKNTLVNVSMEPDANKLNEVVIVQYKVPLIDPYGDGRASRTSEEIERMPTRTTDAVANTAPGVYSKELQIAGARTEGTLYIIDGVQVRGRSGANLAQNSIDQIDTDGENRQDRPQFLKSSKTQKFIQEFMANISGASGMRKEFRDWAIWEPNLWTDEDGNTSFNVRYPDNITSWKTYVLAMNQKGFAGRTFRLTRAFKPLAAQLSAPRFLRYGDSVELIGKVMNYTQEPFKLRAGFTIGEDKQGIDSFTVNNAKVQHTILAAPKENSLDTAELNFAYSLTTENGYTDGEIKDIPVYPVGTIENKGAFYTILNDTVIFSKPSDTNGHFTGTSRLHIDGNLLEVMLREIEKLKEYPHGCTEQLTTKLLAIHYEEAVKKLMKNDTLNNKKVKKQIVEKLVFAQHRNGSFGWFPNNNTDSRVTNYVVSTLQKVNNDGWLDFIIQRGLQYLDNNLQTMPPNDLVAALSTLSAAGYNSNYKPYLDSLDKKQLSIHDQFRIVKVKKEQGYAYRKQLDSLVEQKSESINGTSWGYTGYDWYRNDLSTTLIAYDVIKNDSIYGYLKNDVMRFLLSKRKKGYYSNTAESGLVLTTVLPDLLKEYDPKASRKTEVYISGSRKDTVKNFPAMFEVRNNKAPEFYIQKKGLSPAYVSVVYEYFNMAPKAKKGAFAVHTTFLKNNDTVVTLKQGEKVTMRVSVEALKDAEYVMLEVPIPAGCIQSAKKYSYYNYPEASRENYKDKTFIYCNALNKGRYIFDVELQARYKGSFNVNPAKAEMMYYPEEYGNNEVKRVLVK